MICIIVVYNNCCCLLNIIAVHVTLYNKREGTSLLKGLYVLETDTKEMRKKRRGVVAG